MQHEEGDDSEDDDLRVQGVRDFVVPLKAVADAFWESTHGQAMNAVGGLAPCLSPRACFVAVFFAASMLHLWLPLAECSDSPLTHQTRLSSIERIHAIWRAGC